MIKACYKNARFVSSGQQPRYQGGTEPAAKDPLRRRQADYGQPIEIFAGSTDHVRASANCPHRVKATGDPALKPP